LGLTPPPKTFTAPSTEALRQLAATARRGTFEVKIAGLRSQRAAGDATHDRTLSS
jgi:hypothetical protein